MSKTCKDCGSERLGTCQCPGLRPGHPGPRCHRCWLAFKKRRAAANHERYVQRTYGLEPGEYERLYAFQGGKCWVCGIANGRSKRLAVDHDHQTGEPRGLLCGPCNKDIIGGIERTLAPVATTRLLTAYLSQRTPYRLMRMSDEQC